MLLLCVRDSPTPKSDSPAWIEVAQTQLSIAAHQILFFANRERRAAAARVSTLCGSQWRGTSGAFHHGVNKGHGEDLALACHDHAIARDTQGADDLCENEVRCCKVSRQARRRPVGEQPVHARPLEIAVEQK